MDTCQVSCAPAPCAWFSTPLILNDNELLLVPFVSDKEIFKQNKPKTIESLYKYNILNNEWTKWFKYPSNMVSRYHTTSLNNGKTIVYIYNERGHVIEIDLINKKFNISTNYFMNFIYLVEGIKKQENYIIFGINQKKN